MGKVYRPARTWAGLLLAVGGLASSVQAQELPTAEPPPPVKVPLAGPALTDRPLPVNLPTALRLANASPLDIQIATERIRQAAAQLERARVLWLPTIQFGTDYFRHDGRIQDVAGNVGDTSKSAFLLGAAPVVTFAVTDALFEPLAARQVIRARESALQAAVNDTFLAVAEAYFNVQQARGELAGAEDAVRRAEELIRSVEKLSAPTVQIIAPAEVSRARTELSRRRQIAQAARERWRMASAELVRVLRLDPGVLVVPVEPPQLRVTLVGLDHPLDELIAVGLTNRPELASQQALVQAALARLRQEKIRPLVPSVLLRGAATNPAGTLAGGYFGGGRNDEMGHFGARGDFDLQVLWELPNLGFGTRARVNERRAEHQLSVLELFRTQDRVAAEVTQAHAQLESAGARLGDAETELREAAESLEQNFAGMRQPREGQGFNLVNRPQEVVAAVQALGQAYLDYYGSVADYNRAQFRLYRALGHPAQFVTGATACPPAAAATSRPVQ